LGLLLIAKGFRPGDIFGEQQVKGAPLFGAAKRTLDGKNRSAKIPREGMGIDIPDFASRAFSCLLLVAHSLATHSGTNSFQPCWPSAER